MKLLSLLVLTIFAFSCSTSSYISKKENIVVIKLPSHDWSISFPGNGVETQDEKSSPNGDEGYFLFSNKSNDLTFSFYIEEAPPIAKSAEKCRTFGFLKMQPMLKAQKATGLKMSDSLYYTYEYLIPSINGYQINQFNINSHYYVDGYWIDLHISKPNFNNSDRKTIDDFLSHVTINTKAISQSQSSLELFQTGNTYFSNQEFEKSIAQYKTALELEKVERKLSKEYFYVLIDNLGMSYGITGDFENSEKVYQYGLSIDNKFPMFYYNMACISAEKNDMESSLKNLKEAFYYRNNMLPGEVFPDVEKDDSFKRFMSNDHFKAKIKEFKESN